MPRDETADSILADIRQSMIFPWRPRQRLDPSVIEAETSQIPSDEPYPYEEHGDANYEEVRTHNRFVSRLDCAKCSEYEPENEIVLCELAMIRKCTYACHLKCFEPAWDKIPDEQWICDTCTSLFKCTVCGKNNEKLVICDCCHMIMHRGCTGEEPTKPITSEWQCSSCACAVCGKRELSKIECQLCSRKFHSECVSDFNYEDETCDRCVFNGLVVDLEGTEALESSNAMSLELNDNAEQEESSLDQFIQHCMELLGTETDGIQKCLAEKQIRGLKCLEANSLTAMKFVALQLYADGVKLAPRHWDVLARCIATSLKLDHVEGILRPPPQNLARALRSVAPLALRSAELVCKEGGFTFKAMFHWRDLSECLLQMYTSPVNRAAGRFYNWNHVHCSANRQSGARLPRLIKMFFQNRKQGGKPKDDDVLFLIRLWSDGTITKFTRLHPIVLSLGNFDADMRVLNLKTCQSLLGMVPVRDSLSCFDASGVKVPLRTALSKKVNVNLVLKQFLRDSYKIILREIKRLESGIPVNVFGRTVKMWAVLYASIADLEEKRTLFDLECSRFWHCAHCYLFHGRSEGDFSNEDNVAQEDDVTSVAVVDIFEPPFPIETLRMRTTTKDHEIRQVGKSLQGDPDYAEGKKRKKTVGEARHDFLQWFGLKESCESSFMENVFFLDDSPAAVSRVDLLHNLGGVVARLYKIIRAFAGPHLTRLSQELGNSVIDTPNAMTFYKFEHQLFDFQFILLSLVVEELPEPSKNMPANIYELLSNISFNFMEMVTLLKDDNAGSCAQRFKEVQQKFKIGFKRVEEWYLRLSLGKCGMSCKIHELIEHIDLVQDGCLRDLSTAEGEWTIPLLKQALKAGSLRKEDQSVSALEHFYWSSLMMDVTADARLQYSFETPYDHHDVFRIIGPQFGSQGALQTMENNLINFGLQIDFVFKECTPKLASILRLAGDMLEFGKSVECAPYCKTRGIRIKSEIKISSSRGSQPHLFGVNYQNVEVKEDLGECTSKTNPCRSHHPNVQLFGSASRWKSSRYGMPILFIRTRFGISMVIVRFHTLQPWEINDDDRSRVLMRYSKVFSFELVPMSRLRDRCLIVERKGFLYVFRAGSRVFDHL